MPLAASCGSSSVVSVDRVVTPATETSKVATFRIELSMTTRVQGLPGAITTTSAGVVDTRAQRGHMTVDLSSLRTEAMSGLTGDARRAAAKRLGDAQAWRGEQVIDSSGGRFVTYLRIPALSRIVKTSKPWIRYDFQKLGEQAGSDFQQVTQVGAGDPAQVVDYLRSLSGKVEKKGNEDVRGVGTTHYHVTIDLEKYPSLVPPNRRGEARRPIDSLIALTGAKAVPADVWIGDDGFVRKMEYGYSTPVRDERTGRRWSKQTDVTMELYEFGARAHVRIPSPDAVFDLAKAIMGSK